MKKLFLDTETTGILHQLHGIITISYIVEVDDKVQDKGTIKINPYSYSIGPRKVGEKALEVNGFSVEEIKGFPSAKEGVKELISVLEKYVDVDDREDYFALIGYNIDFDKDFLFRLFQSEGYSRQLGEVEMKDYIALKTVDVFAMVKIAGYLDLIDLKLHQKMDLARACEYFGIAFKAHDSEEDIRATRELYYRMIKLIQGVVNDDKPM